MNLDRYVSAVEGAVEALFNALGRFAHYLVTDPQFLAFSADGARYIFIATSIVLFLVMLITKPRTLLEVSLTFREFILSAVFIVAILARWEQWTLPQWLIIGELHAVSLAGVLVIWAVLKDYFWSYWNSRSE